MTLVNLHELCMSFLLLLFFEFGLVLQETELLHHLKRDAHERQKHHSSNGHENPRQIQRGNTFLAKTHFAIKK